MISKPIAKFFTLGRKYLIGDRITAMLCFKSNYKTTSLPDATPCKTILSLNIIDNTALPYCLFGTLVYHVVQILIPCKQEAN